MVKNILKRNNILLSQFAADLNISRPTLDTYIRNFENGVPIQNALFRKIFDFLFSQITIDNYEFHKRYTYVVSHYGVKHTTIAKNTLDRIVKDGSVHDCLTEDEANTLGEMISKKELILLQMLRINKLLQSKNDFEKLDDKERMVLVGLFEISQKLKKSDFSYNQEIYEKIEAIVIKQSEPKEARPNKVEIMEMINKAIESNDAELIAKITSLLSNN